MSTGTSAAVTEATRLGEIGFPEFTAKLITDTFDALVAANMRQTEAYIELVKQISKSLTEFINDTKDDIGGDQILQFLTNVLPHAETGTKLQEGAKLNKDEAIALNEAVKVEGVQEDVVPVPTSDAEGTTVNKELFGTIIDAVAKRIAADKYTLLKEMVKMGLLRLVVEHGVIETRITFNTYGSTFYEKNASNYSSTGFGSSTSVSTGSLVSKWVKASASASFSHVSISTAKETNRDISGSQVQIYGRVQIDFKTDYQPLAG